jgi:predicted enzyme related to lactoylglutathione lyase
MSTFPVPRDSPVWRRTTCDYFSTSRGAGGAGIAGGVPKPGGWNRFQVVVADLDATVERLAAHGARFRGGIVEGPGGRQILIEDPAGNPVELFQPKRA